MGVLDNYAPVADRIAMFWEAHPNGRIDTDMVRLDDDHVVFRAAAYADRGDATPSATGWAEEKMGQTGRSAEATNPVEVCETSAVGRALANWTFQASMQRPSREEMQSSQRRRDTPAAPAEEVPPLDDFLEDYPQQFLDTCDLDAIRAYATASKDHLSASLKRIEKEHAAWKRKVDDDWSNA